jgi:putative tryptophan/tyrosine transport system substrate-binding protein
MRRREFIAGLGGAAAWPFFARAQQAMPVIGYLSSGSPSGFASRLEAFRSGLQQSGYREGHDVAIEYCWSEGRNEKLAAMASELVQRQVAVLATPGGINAALAAKGATSTIPIVFETGADPVASGLVTSMSRPNGTSPA